MTSRRSHYRKIILMGLSVIAFGIVNADVIMIPTVIVKSIKAVRPYSLDPPVSAIRINQKTIIASHATLLADLLQKTLSGLRIMHSTTDNSQIAVSFRGFGDNAFANSLLIIDGFAITNPSVLVPSLNAISLVDIDHITVLEGSQSSLWGDQAVGGVVKITTLHPNKALANATISYGSYHQTLYNFLIGDHFLNGFFFKLLGFSDKTDNYRIHNQQNDQSIALESGVDYASGSLAFTTQISNNQIELPGGLTWQQYQTDPRQATNSSNFSHFQTQRYQLSHQQILSTRWLLETKVAHDTIQGDGFINSKYSRQDVLDSINPVLTGSVGKNSTIIIGYKGQSSSFQLANTSTQQKADSLQNDIFGQFKIPVLKQGEFILGGRSVWQYTHLNTSTASFTTTKNNQLNVSDQTFNYHLRPTWEVFFKHADNFRLPKANEQTTLPATGKTYLLPQTGVSWETGTKWQVRRQTLQLSIYQLALKNEIAYDPTQTAIAPFGSYSNFPDTLRRGFTFTQRYRLTRQLTGEAQINYVDAHFSKGPNTDKKIPAVPALSGYIGISYYFKPAWQATYTALYTGKQYPSQDLTNASMPVASVWLNNLALHYLYKSIDMSFKIDNIFNQRNLLYAIYSPMDQSNTYYPSAGRNFSFTIKLFS